MNLLSELQRQNKEDREREFRKAVDNAAKIARIYFQAERERRAMIWESWWARAFALSVQIHSN